MYGEGEGEGEDKSEGEDKREGEVEVVEGEGEGCTSKHTTSGTRSTEYVRRSSFGGYRSLCAGLSPSNH